MEEVPTSTLERKRLRQGLLLPDILNELGLTKSKSEGRRLIQQGGVMLNSEKVIDPTFMVTDEHSVDGTILLRLGKKRFHRVVVTPARSV